MQQMHSHSLAFSQEGLRTLWYAYRLVTADEVEHCKHLLRQCAFKMEDVQRNMEEAHGVLECNLTALGVTAIEACPSSCCLPRVVHPLPVCHCGRVGHLVGQRVFHRFCQCVGQSVCRCVCPCVCQCVVVVFVYVLSLCLPMCCPCVCHCVCLCVYPCVRHCGCHCVVHVFVIVFAFVFTLVFVIVVVIVFVHVSVVVFVIVSRYGLKALMLDAAGSCHGGQVAKSRGLYCYPWGLPGPVRGHNNWWVGPSGVCLLLCAG